jgi:hypothetical protein
VLNLLEIRSTIKTLKVVIEHHVVIDSVTRMLDLYTSKNMFILLMS